MHPYSRRSYPLPDLTHIQYIREEMPATTYNIYPNTGTFGPQPAVAIQAIQDHLQAEWRDGRLGAAGFESMANIYKNARSSVARLLNADADEISLTDNTGEGLNIISYGLNWHEGDEVITTNHEHFSALAPLYQLRHAYGVVIRCADIGPRGDAPILKAFADQVTPRTRLIVLSHVTWTTGAVLELNAIGNLDRERGIPVLVDAAQSPSAISVDVKALAIEFYAMPMQQWLWRRDVTCAMH